MKRILCIASILLMIISLFVWQATAQNNELSIVLFLIFPLFFTLICFGLAYIIDSLEKNKSSVL